MKPSLIAAVFLGSSINCSQPPADPGDVGVSLCFVTAPNVCGTSNVTLPLDTADNLSFQVQVTATIPNFVGPVKAHLSLIGAAGTTASSTVVDTIATLEPSGTNTLSATVTLNALQTGPLTVQAEVAGVMVSESAQLPDPVIVGNAIATGSWSGTTPRIAICVETSAVKGTVSLTADDPAVLTATSSSPATLVPGPCVTPAVAGGPGVSHAQFVTTFTPPFTVVAQLVGRPTTASASPWQTPINVVASVVDTVSLTFESAVVDPTLTVPNATVYDVTVDAMWAGTTIAVPNLPVTLSGSTGTTISPTSVTTGATGYASTVVVVPFNTQATVTATGGNATAIQSLAGTAPVPLISLTAAPSPTVTVPNGAVYDVTATATTGQAPTTTGLPGLLITFAASGGSLSAATATTGKAGTAFTHVIVPTGTLVIVTATGDGVEAILALGSPTPAVTVTLTPTPVMSEGSGGELYSLTALVETVATQTASATPVTGAMVTFGSTTSGLSPTPASATTDSTGTATTGFVLSKNTSAVITAAVDGVLQAQVVSDIPPATVTNVTWSSSATIDSGGTLFTITAQVFNGTTPVSSTSVAFSALVTSSTGLVADPVIPGSVLTDASGNAITEVYVPTGEDAVVTALVAGTTWTKVLGP